MSIFTCVFNMNFYFIYQSSPYKNQNQQLLKTLVFVLVFKVLEVHTNVNKLLQKGKNANPIAPSKNYSAYEHYIIIIINSILNFKNILLYIMIVDNGF